MKAFLNFFGQFSEWNFHNPARKPDHNSVRFDAAYRGVFVFFAVNGLKSSASASDADSAATIASPAFQYFTRWIVPLLVQESGTYSVLLFLAEFLESGIGARRFEQQARFG